MSKVPASLNKVADETVETGKKLARTLLKNKKVPHKGLANVPVDYEALHSSTQLLGLIYRLLVRSREETILKREEEDSHSKQVSLEKDRNIEELVKALTLKIPKRKKTKSAKPQAKPTSTRTNLPLPSAPIATATSVAVGAGKAILGIGAISGGLAISAAIAKGESAKGSYNAANMGTRNDKIVPIKSPVNLENMTIKEVMQRQAIKWGSPNEDQKLFAVGKYQMIPGTLSGAVKTLNIDTNQKFTGDLQEKIFKEYLIGAKNPDIAKYLNSPTDDPKLLYNALKSLSNEWASIADPDKPGGMTSHYGSGNKASISVEQMATLLKSDRESIQKQKTIENVPSPKTGDRIDASSKENADMKNAASVKPSVNVNNMNINKSKSSDDTSSSEGFDDRAPYLKKK